MLKELAKWMQAGLGGIALAIAEFLQRGGPVTFRSLLTVLVSAALIRLAGWLTLRFGPQP